MLGCAGSSLDVRDRPMCSCALLRFCTCNPIRCTRLTIITEHKFDIRSTQCVHRSRARGRPCPRPARRRRRPARPSGSASGVACFLALLLALLGDAPGLLPLPLGALAPPIEMLVVGRSDARWSTQPSSRVQGATQLTHLGVFSFGIFGVLFVRFQRHSFLHWNRQKSDTRHSRPSQATRCGVRSQPTNQQPQRISTAAGSANVSSAATQRTPGAATAANCSARGSREEGAF